MRKSALLDFAAALVRAELVVHVWLRRGGPDAVVMSSHPECDERGGNRAKYRIWA